jgi:putative NADH-flavin reductase
MMADCTLTTLADAVTICNQLMGPQFVVELFANLAASASMTTTAMALKMVQCVRHATMRTTFVVSGAMSAATMTTLELLTIKRGANLVVTATRPNASGAKNTP